MDGVLVLHERLGTTLVLYLAAVGLWGLALGVLGRGPNAAYRGSLVIAEIAAIAQGLIGLALLASRGIANWIHILYGVALVIVLPFAATFVRDRQPRGQSFGLGLAALFALGLALRGCTTAR